MLSFPINGFSLALDFPNTKNVRRLQEELNKIVCEFGGRVYLAKDAMLSAEIFEKMYEKHLPKWRRIIYEVDPSGNFESLMSKRLNFRGGKND